MEEAPDHKPRKRRLQHTGFLPAALIALLLSLVFPSPNPAFAYCENAGNRTSRNIPGFSGLNLVSKLDSEAVDPCLRLELGTPEQLMLSSTGVMKPEEIIVQNNLTGGKLMAGPIIWQAMAAHEWHQVELAETAERHDWNQFSLNQQLGLDRFSLGGEWVWLSADDNLAQHGLFQARARMIEDEIVKLALKHEYQMVQDASDIPFMRSHFTAAEINIGNAMLNIGRVEQGQEDALDETGFRADASFSLDAPEWLPEQLTLSQLWLSNDNGDHGTSLVTGRWEIAEQAFDITLGIDRYEDGRMNWQLTSNILDFAPDIGDFGVSASYGMQDEIQVSSISLYGRLAF